MMVARGSKFLYILWPNPISLKLEFLSLDLAMMSYMVSPLDNIP